jgi:hypothetical protein
MSISACPSAPVNRQSVVELHDGSAAGQVMDGSCWGVGIGEERL